MRTFMMIIVAVLLAGCSPYVNIPKQPGDMANHSANDGTAKRIAAVALKHVVDQRTMLGQYSIALSSGATAQTYQWVLAKLPEGGSAVTVDGAGVTPMFMVASIYVRGGTGQVDIIITRHDREQRLVSVYCNSGAAGWYVIRDRMWAMPVDEALRMAFPHRSIDPTYLEPEPNGESPVK